jgi:hypothetical protein
MPTPTSLPVRDPVCWRTVASEEDPCAGEAFTLLYIFCVGAYRGLYLVNWIYRYFTEPHYWQPLVWVAGVVQTLLYADFFYYYIIAVKEGSKFQLPG